MDESKISAPMTLTSEQNRSNCFYLIDNQTISISLCGNESIQLIFFFISNLYLMFLNEIDRPQLTSTCHVRLIVSTQHQRHLKPRQLDQLAASKYSRIGVSDVDLLPISIDAAGSNSGQILTMISDEPC